MSDVKLICVYNQFDYNGTLYESNEGTDLKEIAKVTMDDAAAILCKHTNEYSTNDVWVMGDNTEFLRGFCGQVANDYALYFSNQKINLHIIGE